MSSARIEAQKAPRWGGAWGDGVPHLIGGMVCPSSENVSGSRNAYFGAFSGPSDYLLLQSAL